MRGAPFSAIAISKTIQTLSDGSRVARARKAQIYRGGEGRVRFEFGRNARKGAGFTLYEAVSVAIYIISSKRRVALQLSPPKADASLRRAKIIIPQSPPEDLKAVVGEMIESLGSQIIEGVHAEGIRVTSTAPAKEGSSEQPGRIIYERWYSRELRKDVLIRRSDPRFGEAVYRLTDIKLVEPSVDLFRIPDGYQVEPANFGSPSRGGKTN